MSAAARGAAGYLRMAGMIGRGAEARRREAARTQAEAQLSRFIKSPERVRELAAEAVKNFDTRKK